MHLEWKKKCNIFSKALTSWFVFTPWHSVWFISSYCRSRPLTFLVVSLQLRRLCGFTPLALVTAWHQISNISSCVCMYLLACITVSAVEAERRNTDCFLELRPERLTAYLPNPSSVAKDPLLPGVTPSRCHLGNRCRGELPSGIADLCWLRSIKLQSIALPQWLHWYAVYNR